VNTFFKKPTCFSTRFGGKGSTLAFIKVRAVFIIQGQYIAVLCEMPANLISVTTHNELMDVIPHCW